MIASIKGIVEAVGDDFLVVEIGGFSLQVFVPMAQFDRVPELGEEIKLHTAFLVREDLWQLFGFSEKEQLAMFNLLNTVSGIGAKTALAILNLLPPALVAANIAADNSEIFQKVPGVGKKTAQRLTLELKDKCAKLGFAAGIAVEKRPVESLAAGPIQEVATALSQLGFGNIEARHLASQASQALGKGANLEELVMAALKLAAR